MFKTKERIEKLEGQISALKTYCSALDKEQKAMYDAIIKGLEYESEELDIVHREFLSAKDKRKKIFESIQGLFKVLM